MHAHLSVLVTTVCIVVTDVAPSEANREQRMIEIKTRKELVNTVKSQDETYSSLRAEVERLRMKTFPALVQVD